MFSYRHAPPSGSRKFGTYKWLWHIPPIFTILSILPTVCCVPKPPVGGEPGCEVPSSLLAALIRARAPMVWGPLNLLCLLLLLLLLLLFFSGMNRIFEGLNMLEKSWNFAHASDLAKIYIWYWFQKWVWQNGSTAPPMHFQRCAPRATFHVHVWKSVHSCNTPIPTKKSLEAKSQTQQEVGYFN